MVRNPPRVTGPWCGNHRYREYLYRQSSQTPFLPDPLAESTHPRHPRRHRVRVGLGGCGPVSVLSSSIRATPPGHRVDDTGGRSSRRPSPIGVSIRRPSRPCGGTPTGTTHGYACVSLPRSSRSLPTWYLSVGISESSGGGGHPGVPCVSHPHCRSYRDN